MITIRITPEQAEVLKKGHPLLNDILYDWLMDTSFTTDTEDGLVEQVIITIAEINSQVPDAEDHS